MLLSILLMMAVGLFAADRACRGADKLAIFVLAAGILRFGGDANNVAGTNLSALWLLFMIALAGLAMLRFERGSALFPPAAKLYALFLLWCLFEATRAPNLMFAARAFLKLLYPMLALLLAGRAALLFRQMPAHAIRWMLAVAAVAGVALHEAVLRLLPDSIVQPVCSLTWSFASFIDYAVLMGMLALAWWRFSGQRRYLLLAAWLASAAIVGGTRTGILAFAVGSSIFCLLEFKRRGLPLLAIIVIGFGSTIFLVPAVREKMFLDTGDGAQTAQISLSNLAPNQLGEQLNSNGRFSTWNAVLTRFFKPAPIHGSGLGATQAWFYTQGDPTQPSEMRMEHSEYVKLLSDTGVIGLALYLAALIACAGGACRAYRQNAQGVQRVLALAILSGVPAFMICMAFDNVLVYALPAAQYPFALAGLLWGMRTPKPRLAIAPDSIAQEPAIAVHRPALAFHG